MRRLVFTLISLISITTVNSQQPTVSIVKTANENATPEAKKLLAYLYSISGKKTLSGMHNVLGRMSVNTDSVYLLTGKYPAIWGGDFGFADSTHDIDNIKYRSSL